MQLSPLPRAMKRGALTQARTRGCGNWPELLRMRARADTFVVVAVLVRVVRAAACRADMRGGRTELAWAGRRRQAPRMLTI